MQKPVLFLFVLVILASIGSQVKAEMTGSTYKINWDSVNTGGGEDLSGSTYHMYSTISEVGPGNSGGATYNLDAGYQQRDGSGTFAFDISTDTCDLGTLIYGEQMGGCVITLTTSTTATDGYVTTVYDESTGLFDGGSNDIDDVAVNSAITNNAEAFGISTEDNNADVAEFTTNGGDITTGVCVSGVFGPLENFDPLSNTAISIVETAAAETDEATDICIAAGAGSVTADATYTNNITFTSTGYY